MVLIYLIPKNIKIKKEIFKGFGILEIIAMAIAFGIGFLLQSFVNDYRLKVFLKHIDRILKEFREDPYYEIIELKYFKNKTIDEIAEIMKKDTSTISRNKNRLINEIKVKLLPNEIITEIINY